MCWVVDFDIIDKWLKEKYRFIKEDSYQCSNGHKHKGKFCSECGSPISKIQIDVENDFNSWDWLMDWDWKFNEENTNIYYPIRNLRNDYVGLNQSFLEKINNQFVKDVDGLDDGVRDFIKFLNSQDESELCIFDDGYYNREWSNY